MTSDARIPESGGATSFALIPHRGCNPLPNKPGIRRALRIEIHRPDIKPSFAGISPGIVPYRAGPSAIRAEARNYSRGFVPGPDTAESLLFGFHVRMLGDDRHRSLQVGGLAWSDGT